MFPLVLATMETGSFILFFTLAILLCFMNGLAMEVKNITTDQSALVAFKSHVTGDPRNLLAANWTTATSVCSWIGVTCGIRHHRVTALDLSSMDLAGKIPPDIGNLSFLNSLSLRGNRFNGSLPIELSGLHRLEDIDLGFNDFGGEIPSWFGSFTELRSLQLLGNKFRGGIPVSLFNMSKLEMLNLYKNSLQGSIPEAIGNLQKLKTLYLDENELSGSIPSTIFNISSLQTIDLSHNQLSGFMPPTTFNVSSLRILDLAANNISGHFPWEMFCHHHLPELEALYLTWNMFSGRIPSSLFQCTRLVNLSLSNNYFEGGIPDEIGNLTRLKMLYLGINDLNGEIPRRVGDLRSLEIFSIPQTRLTGSIPPAIVNLTQLKLIDLIYNNLTGAIPEIGNFNKLETLHLAENNFTGFIPSSIFNSSTMTHLSLSGNDLSGHLPTSIGSWLPNLEWLVLGGNKLSGPIPASISNASQLIVIEFSFNALSGPIPDSLGNLRDLQRLHMSNNRLTTGTSSSELSFLSSLTNCKDLTKLTFGGNSLSGTIPTSIGNLSASLQDLSAHSCKIKGTIPGEIGNLSSLTLLNLENNDLTGIIPTSIGRLDELQSLTLWDNKLQGYIPSELCRLEKLAYLYLGANHLSGSIPECFDNLKSLRELGLGMNRLTGTLPSALWRLENILSIDLLSNSLSGSLSSDIGNLEVVTHIDLSNNRISGDIPNSFADLQAVEYLSLSDNRLQGHIPESFGNLVSLEFLDLSKNSLNGGIPKSLEKLRYLKLFNVSFNRLQGEIPNAGPFANLSVQSFMGNEALCGATRLQVPPCKPVVTKRSRKAIVTILLVYVLPITASTLLVVAIVLLLMRRRMNRKKLPAEESVSVLPLAAWRRTSYREISQATDGFNKSNLIGVGSYGSVYRGILADGMKVAVKVFNKNLEGAFQSFESECEVMSSIRHRNLLKLISCCSNDDFKALLLDYMVNGSLEMRLYSDDHYLGLLQRLEVVLDIASALEYLHHSYSSPIVHCDIKPSNVLLDENMVAHLSDFGISKLLGEEQSGTLTKTLATIGYMAPEYGREGKVSTKGDVYSYGILLMETFTRKRPTDESFVGDMSLKQLVRNSLLFGSAIEVVDSNLLGEDDEHYAAKERCLESILSLAINCTSDSPKDRMNMKEVGSTLHKIKCTLVANIERD